MTGKLTTLITMNSTTAFLIGRVDLLAPLYFNQTIVTTSCFDLDKSGIINRTLIGNDHEILIEISRSLRRLV